MRCAKRWKYGCSLLLAGLASLTQAASDPNPFFDFPQRQTQPATQGSLSRVWLKDAEISLQPGIGFQVDQLQAIFRPQPGQSAVRLDDPNSFIIDVDGGSLFVSDATLSRLFNADLSQAGAPLRNLQLHTHPSHLEVSAELNRKGRWRPLTMWCSASISGPMEVTLSPQRLIVDQVDVTAALSAASVDMDEVLKLTTAHMALVGNSIRVRLEGLFPPPALQFQVTGLKPGDGGLGLTLSKPGVKVEMPTTQARPGYVWLEGGTLKVADVTLGQAYVVALSLDDKTPLFFDLARLRDQLDEGAIRIRQDGLFLLGVKRPQNSAGVTP